jgi:L-iditol 2-dehydrogenase
MRVAVYGENGRFAIEERLTPSPGPGEVVVRVELCGVSGADVLAVREGRAQPGAVFGSELTGAVTAAGSAVTGFAAGDRVATVTTDEAEPGGGGFAEYAAVPASALTHVPATVPAAAATAALTATVATAWNAVADSRVRLGSTVGIVGAGPLGLTVLDLVLGMRPAAVHVVEPLAERRARAVAAGATRVFGREDNPGVFFLNELEPGGADVIFDCAGARGTLQYAAVLARGGGGQVMMAAWYDGPDAIDPNAVIKEIDIRATLPRRDMVAQAIGYLANGGGARTAALVSRTVGLDGLQEVFDTLWTPASTDLKVLVAPAR